MTHAQAIWNDGRWLFFIGAIWLALAVVVLWPASWWFSVESLTVLDADQGNSPVVILDRTIRREFHGQWVVTVMRQGTNGFYTHCTAGGENDYRPDAALPDVVDLDWWMTPTRCSLPPGLYYVKTLWTINRPGLPAKEVRVQSNVFKVTSKNTGR